MAQLLAGLGLLEPACAYYRIYVAQDTVDACQRALLLASEGEQTAAWLEDLQARIAGGVRTGRYVPIAPADGAKLANDETSLLIQSLESLLEVPGAAADALWVDDRMLSGYATTGSVPIVGICEMLVALVDLRALTVDQYYHAADPPARAERALHCVLKRGAALLAAAGKGS